MSIQPVACLFLDDITTWISAKPREADYMSDCIDYDSAVKEARERGVPCTAAPPKESTFIWKLFGDAIEELSQIEARLLANGQQVVAEAMRLHYEQTATEIQAFIANGKLWLDRAEAAKEAVSRIAMIMQRRPQAARRQDDSPAAKQMLFGWRAILKALGVRYEKDKCREVARLNSTYAGPIISGGRGTQPMVDEEKLVAWWNNLELLAAKTRQKRIDTKATAAGTHNYGSKGVVVPEIGGSVRFR